jgi:hypothetical protein
VAPGCVLPLRRYSAAELIGRLTALRSVALFTDGARVPFGFAERVLHLAVLGAFDDVGSFVRGGAYQCQAAFLQDVRDAVLTVIVCANTRPTARSVNPMLISARDPSVA